MIKPVAHVAAMAPYALADLGGTEMVSLAQNESAFRPSPLAIAAGRAALDDAALYPDPDWRGLRDALAEIHGVDAAHILCGAGSMELIGCLIRAFARPGDEVLGSQYGYLFTASATQQAGAKYLQAPETDHTVSVDALLAAVTPHTRIAFVCNPGNPTGTRIANADIVRLRHSLPQDVLLIVDQAYGEFDDQSPQPVLDLVARGDTVVLRTLSKAYGLAGARVGWGVFPPAVAVEVRKLLNPNNIAVVSQAMAAAAVRDQSHMQQVVRDTSDIRKAFSAKLTGAGYPVPESHTNFVLIPFAGQAAAGRADAQLRKAGYLLRGMGGYGLGHCLRATIAARDVMDAVADKLISFKEAGHDI